MQPVSSGGHYSILPYLIHLIKLADPAEGAHPLSTVCQPLPLSQVNVNISRQVAIFGVILPLHKGQKWVKIFSPPLRQPDRFFRVFLEPFP